MRVRRLTLGTAVAVLGLALTSCEEPSGINSGGNEVSVNKDAKFEDGTTMARLNKNGKVTIGTKFDQPLFGLKGLDGKPQGFDIEIAKIITGKLGITPDKIEWVEAPAKVREEIIEQGKVDFVVATYTINDKRKERISFAGPYYQAGQTLMVKKDNSTITGPDTLRAANAKVCTTTGSVSAETIKKYIDASNLVLFDVHSKCADALRTGQVDVVNTDNVVLLGLIEKSNGEFKLAGKPFTKEPYGIGIKKGDIKFCQFINDTLKAASSDGSYERAWKSTADKVASDTPKLPELDTCG